jgi:hypothetical protein
MRFLRSVPVMLAGFLLIAHGIAHAPGVLGSFDLASFDDATRQPNALFTNAGDTLLYVLGVFWLVAALTFVVAGAGVALRMAWARQALVAAVAVSLPVTMLWYQDAVVGLVINIALLVILVAWLAWNTVTGKRMTTATS